MNFLTGQLYRNFYENQVILTALKSNTILTLGQIQTATDSLTSGKDLTQPQFKSSTYKIQPKETSSATKMNQTIDTIGQDLTIAFETIQDLGPIIVYDIDNTLLKLRNIQSQLIELQSEINSKLLIAKNVDGYINILYDDFVDMTYIDCPQTTAFVDLKSQAVFAGFNLETYKDNPLQRIMFNPLTIQEDIGIMSIALNTENVTSVNSFPENSVYDCFLDNKNAWVENIYCKTKDQNVGIQFIVQFLKENKDLSKIVIDPHMSGTSGQVSILVQYSLDGVNWTSINETPLQTITSRGIWLCNVKQVKSLKITVSKNNADDQDKVGFVYEFGFNKIELYASDFQTGVSQLYSVPRSYFQENGDRYIFNKVALETCELVLATNTLKYYIAFGYTFDDGTILYERDSNQDIIYHAICPLNQANPQSPTMLEVTPTYTQSIRNIWTDTRKTGFKYKDIDGLYLLTRPLETFNIESQLIVLRNIKSYKLPYMIKGNNTFAPRGWWFDNYWYSCYMNIDSVGYANGLTLDFGQTEIEIDDSIQSGIVYLEPGLHKIRIKVSNWLDLDNQNAGEIVNFFPSSPIGEVTGFDPVAKTFHGTGMYTEMGGVPTESAIQDPLYPYNQKYLIEGLRYTSTFKTQSSNIKYPDANYITISACQMAATSNFDISTNVVLNPNLKYYSIVDSDQNLYGGNSTYYGPKYRTIVILRPQNDGFYDWVQANNISLDIDDKGYSIDQVKQIFNLLTVEEYQVIECIVKVGSGNFLEYANTVILRADFETSDPKKSPILNNYKIRLGL